MTKYKAMIDAAVVAENNFNGLQRRSVQLLADFIAGLATYCDIPLSKIRYLKWNGLSDEARQYLEINQGYPNILPAAVEFDKTDGFWHVGIVVNLSPETEYAPNYGLPA